MGRLQIAVVTPSFPTQEEPYRGAPIWCTLQHLARHADLVACCAQPDYLFRHKPHTYVYSDPVLDTPPDMEAQAVTYFAVPWLTRRLNGQLLYRSLRSVFRTRPPALLLPYRLYPEGYASALLGRELGIPFVVGSRGSDLKLLPPDGIIPQRVRTVLQLASAILCVSDDLGAAARRLGARAERVHVIHNGVDQAIFACRDQAEARRCLGLAPGARVVLYVGRLATGKGLPQLVEAVQILTRRSGEEWIAVLVGAGFLEETLRTQAGRDDSKVLFTGALSPGQVADWMNAADVLCLPSESEGCPNVILEALSCGRPVVATAVGGIPELITEQSGILVPSHDPACLADALDRACRTTWDRAAIAQSRRRTWEDVALETLRVCEQAVLTHGAGR